MNAFWRYAAHPDPLVATGNLLALMLGGNTPFYPLFVYALVGNAAFPRAFWGLLVLPVFMAVPAVARRAPLSGRVLLVAAGTANTVLCSYVYGIASGVWLFLVPCAALATLLFRVGERRALVLAALLPIGAYMLLTGRFGPQTVGFGALFGLNAGSTGSLSLFMGLVFSRLYQPRA